MIMGTYIVQSVQFAFNPAEDDGQTPHVVYERGAEVELDDENPHTNTLVKQGVVVSKRAHENRENAQAEASRLDKDVSSDETGSADATSNAGPGTGTTAARSASKG